MSIALWMLSGAIVGRLGYSVRGFHDAQAKTVAVVLGAVGGVVGGYLVAPMFTATAAPGDSSASALFFAAAVAAVFLFVRYCVRDRREL